WLPAEPLEKLRSAVRRAIVDDDDLDARVVLSPNGCDGLGEQTLLVEHGNDDADESQSTLRHAGGRSRATHAATAERSDPRSRRNAGTAFTRAPREANVDAPAPAIWKIVLGASARSASPAAIGLRAGTPPARTHGRTTARSVALSASRIPAAGPR